MNQDIIYVFNQNQLKDTKYEKLVVVKDGSNYIDNDALVIEYSKDFETYLNFSLASKNRKTKQLLSLNESLEVLNRISYGVLSFTHESIPYSVGLNHTIIEDKIYFHCAKQGFKLKGLEHPVSYLVIEDLGISEAASTHNHRSVYLQGTLKLIDDPKIKSDALNNLMHHLTPNKIKPLNNQMIANTNILQLEVNYMIGKVHIR